MYTRESEYGLALNLHMLRVLAAICLLPFLAIPQDLPLVRCCILLVSLGKLLR